MQKGNDVVTTFIGGCFAIVIVFILFVVVMGLIL